jgi:hypothetical protein
MPLSAVQANRQTIDLEIMRNPSDRENRRPLRFAACRTLETDYAMSSEANQTTVKPAL